MQIKFKDFNNESFKKAIKNEGFCVVENIIDKDFALKMRTETEFAIKKEAEFHKTENYNHYGVVQACPMYGGAFLELLENKEFIDPFNQIMGEGCIIYVYISSSMPPNGINFSTRVHVDRPRLFPDYCECLAALVLLDDFSEDNGSTWLLPKSHNTLDEPSEAFFYKNAFQIKAPLGSVLYFNLRLWHAGGKNHTNKWRHAVSIGMVRPNLKQKFDLPNMMNHYGVDTSNVSDFVKQKLGFNAIPPKSLDEFYTTEDKRTYKEKSEWEIVKSEKNI